MNTLLTNSKIIGAQDREGVKYYQIVDSESAKMQWVQASCIPFEEIQKYENEVRRSHPKILEERDEQEIEKSREEKEDQNDKFDLEKNEKQQGQKVSDSVKQSGQKLNEDKDISDHFSQPKEDNFFEDNGSEMEQSQSISDINAESSPESGQKYGEYRPTQYRIGSKNKNKVKFKKFANIKTKQKTKNIKKRVESRRGQFFGINKDNILDERMRQTGVKNYKEEFIDPKMLIKEKNKSKSELADLNKKILRCKQNQQVLIQSVISSHQIESERYFCVKLVNEEEVMISEAHMNRFFPNKLTKYYQNLINVMTSTFLIPN